MISFVTFMALAITSSSAQGFQKEVGDSVCHVLQRITSEVAGNSVKVVSLKLQERGNSRIVEVHTSAEMGYYPMRSESIEHIHNEVRRVLPREYRNYPIEIYTNGRLINELIPQLYSSTNEPSFKHASGTPLITRESRLSQPKYGLNNRHIALWQSHGRYFNSTSGEWDWQRSRQWETVEDLYTQGYVIPYLVHMLERAGASVLLPRERSMMREEVIIDNDKGIDKTTYTEQGEWRSAGKGFAHLHESYPSGHNPFEDGTARSVRATSTDENKATATWGGEIPKSGIYTVYVSYATQDKSVNDAHYTVHTSGGDHEFRVNQQMGGSMWVALGEFYFEAGNHPKLVTISNDSMMEGVVTADGVKIGGGMGNIRRIVADDLHQDGVEYTEELSRFPRYAEGARYWLQWSGFSKEVYNPNADMDDYKDDYMSRAHWVNALMGGSEYLSEAEGKRIPLDLALAFHTDAGVSEDDEIIGTLGIYSTAESEGKFAFDVSRLRSRDLTDIVMTQIVDDIRAKYEPRWSRRGMWDKAYYEARIPACPTMLLELLSHQNFADMRYGLDPAFRFDVSRAIYKGILRYLSSQYQISPIVQPLPVNSFVAELRGGKALLSWEATVDELEATAAPDYYIVYTRVDNGSFDTGRRVDETSVEMDIDAGKIYSFRVTAVNEGGESFDSETLAVCRAQRSKGEVLIVNGFDRVAAPMSIRNDSIAGFYNRYDAGVGDRTEISFIGEQTIFNRSLMRSDNDNYALGSSYNDYEAQVIAGNTFDYPALHGRAIVEAGYSFGSASHSGYAKGKFSRKKYDVVDLILGKQRATAIGRGTSGYHYEVLSDELEAALRADLSSGRALMVSGSYLLSELWHGANTAENDSEFAKSVLSVRFGGNMATRRGEVYAPATKVMRKGLEFKFNTEPSEQVYSVESPEVVVPNSTDSFTMLRYSNTGESAAVATNGQYRTVVIGFPFETITDEESRNELMSTTLKFLMKKK